VAKVQEVVRNPGAHQPEIVVLDIASVGPSELESLAAIRVAYGDIPVIVVSEALDDAQVRKLLKQKVHDWLKKPLVHGDFLATLQSAIRSAKQSHNLVHAVISASGGAGATTVAIALADMLAKRTAKSGGNVGLFDLDFSTGSCGMALNLLSPVNLDSVLSAPSRIDGEFANLIQQRHPHGFHVYSFKRREVVTHLNCYELVLRMLDVVTMEHSHTILDIPYYETDWRQDVLSAVNTVTVVSELNLPAIKHTLDILRSIEDLPGGTKPVQVLLNKTDRGLFGGTRIPSSKLKDLFGTTPFDFLPRDDQSMEEAMDRGVILSEVNPGSKFLKALGKHGAKVLAEPTLVPA
jgi:pilus assembly protein CpaE